MLNWGKACSDWFKTEYPKLNENPPFLLYGTDFEIISFERIIEEIESFSDEDDYRQTKKEFYNKFIPFGMTGGGDLYCFYLNDKNSIESIVVVYHDDNEVEILSDNLENFMFRNLLECVIDPFEDSLIMNGDFKVNITRQLLSHQKYLNNDQLKIISEIYNRDTQPLLKYEEFNQILENWNFNISNNTFEYQKEEYKENNQSFTNKNNIRNHIEYRLSITCLPEDKLKLIKEIRKISEISISDLLNLNEFPLVVYENTLSLFEEIKLKNFTSSDKDVLLHLSEFYSDNIKLEYRCQIEKGDYKELK